MRGRECGCGCTGADNIGKMRRGRTYTGLETTVGMGWIRPQRGRMVLHSGAAAAAVAAVAAAWEAL